MMWVQQVDILYTKASRGAPAATNRNRLPRAFVTHHGDSESYAFEHYRLLEWSDFVPTLTEAETALLPPTSQGDLVIDATRGMVTLGLRWNQAIGQPPRHHKLGAISLSKGQIACLMINGRYTSYSGQTYTEATYNVAYDDVIRPDVFLRAQVDAVLDMRADLF
jgi:hypothetical protein